MLYFGEKHPSYWSKIEVLLIMLFDKSLPEVLFEISNIISFQRVELPENILHLLVKQLANVTPEQKCITDNIDRLLVRLVEKGESSLAIELLESTIVAGVEFKSLSYFSNELLSKHQNLCNHIITKWFLNGDILMCRGISNILNGVTGKDTVLKADARLLDNEEKKSFVIRKAVGWLFTRPIAAASFLLSIPYCTTDKILKELEGLLYDPLLLSYPGELKRFFQSCIDNSAHEHLCKQLLDKLKYYHINLESISKLQELKSSNENIRTYWKDVDKSMQQAHEEASKNSFIRQIAKTQVILYGNSSIYYQHQENGNSIRQEMLMQTFSHSTEMPRLNILDPVSLDYLLMNFRFEKMNNETNT